MYGHRRNIKFAAAGNREKIEKEGRNKNTWPLVTAFGILSVRYFIGYKKTYTEEPPTKSQAIILEHTQEKQLNAGEVRMT